MISQSPPGPTSYSDILSEFVERERIDRTLNS